MKYLPLPSRPQLSRVYERLQWEKDAPGPEDVVSWAHWSRLDARLAELLVYALPRKFRQINPNSLWERNSQSPQPQALAVLLDFSLLEARRSLSKHERAAFRNWVEAVRWRILPGPPQLFFLREGMPNPERDKEELRRSLRPFRKWGFFGAASPLSAKKPVRATLIPRAARARCLSELRKRKSSFTVADYIAACGGHVHRRTAERDLKALEGLRRRGKTSGLRYERRSPGRQTKAAKR